MKGKKLLTMFMVVLSMFVMLSSSVTAAVPEEDLSETYYLKFDLPYPYPQLGPEPVFGTKPSVAYVEFSSDSGKIVTISGEWAPKEAVIYYAIYYGELSDLLGSKLPLARQTGKISINDIDEFTVKEAGTYTLVITQISYNEKFTAISHVVGHLEIVVPEKYSF